MHRLTNSDKVNAAHASGARNFESGSESSFEILQMSANDGIAYWAGIQWATARMKGKPEAIPFNLRVTEVFRREGDGWKLVHRHADSLPPAPEREKAKRFPWVNSELRFRGFLWCLVPAGDNRLFWINIFDLDLTGLTENLLRGWTLNVRQSDSIELISFQVPAARAEVPRTIFHRTGVLNQCKTARLKVRS
jgi:ketosteroid isomerase-like protein